MLHLNIQFKQFNTHACVGFKCQTKYVTIRLINHKLNNNILTIIQFIRALTTSTEVMHSSY